MAHTKKVKTHPTGYEGGAENKRRPRNFLFSKFVGCHVSPRRDTGGPRPRPPVAPVSSSADSHELCAAMGVHRLTSRTSVGVLDWSCCSLALLPAWTPMSCGPCWRLAASTRSICSWHALRQSWNGGGGGKGSDIVSRRQQGAAAPPVH